MATLYGQQLMNGYSDRGDHRLPHWVLLIATSSPSMKALESLVHE